MNEVEVISIALVTELRITHDLSTAVKPNLQPVGIYALFQELLCNNKFSSA